MKLIQGLLLLIGSVFLQVANGQELYIFTEPASNMAANSLGVRLNNDLMPMRHGKSIAYRLNPELMWGVNKNLMVHANMYMSNMFQPQFKVEGASAYAKYRFLSVDDLHRHFRMAGFGKVSVSSNPPAQTYQTKHLLPNGSGGFVEHTVTSKHAAQELVLDGNNSGMQWGVVATQLLHKLAVSASGSYITRWNNTSGEAPIGVPNGNWQATLSAGYLLFPKKYTSYGQTNINLYVESIAQKLASSGTHFVDLAPGIQFIFNSISRLDLGYRFQVSGNMSRFNNRLMLVRFEYNFLNVFK